MPVRLASHLVQKHDVTITYPLVKHYTTYHRLVRTSIWSKLKYIYRELRQYKSRFVFQDDLDPNVKLETYLLTPSEAALRRFDVIIYESPWHYHAVKHLSLGNVRKIHWVLADHLFANAIGFSINDILESFQSGDVLVAPSQFIKKNVETYGFKVEALIPGGIDPIFHANGRRRNSGRPSILGYFQPAWWKKGAATMVQCAQILRLRHPDIRIELFGHQRTDIEKRGSQICDRFYTRLSSRQVADLCRAHDIFVYTSYSDGFQSPPLEAMACGCAVVATRVGAVPDYATHEQNALLCDPMDFEGIFRQVERLILDNNLRHRLGAQAAKDAPRWKWADCADQFDELIRRL